MDSHRIIFSTVSGVLLPILLVVSGCQGLASVQHRNSVQEGQWISLFDGKTLAGWKGLVGNPISRDSMAADQLALAQSDAERSMRAHWSIQEGVLCFDGKGSHLCTANDFSDFILELEWKIEPGGDSGIYLRGCPQVQIWDVNLNPVGSGGLYNNQQSASQPLLAADRPAGQWNHFRISMVDKTVTVQLNDKLVVHKTPLENYWDRAQAIPETGQIELQSHGSRLWFRNIRIKRTRSNDQIK